MDNFSPLPAAASDSRLSRPEAVAPNEGAVSPALAARRQKLRRVVAWVVGGAALLMCIGLVRAAIRAHATHAAEAEAEAAASMPAPVAPLVAAAAAPAPSATQADPTAAAEPAPEPAATVAPKAAKKASSTAGHALSPKNAKRTTLSKNIRH